MHTAPAHLDLHFRVDASEGRARSARFETPHGDVLTPAFMPVATRASVKGLTQTHVRELAPQVLLANTYHLHLRPGETLVRDLGGLHAFMAWDGPILTDSGGYQVFSLTSLVRVSAEGAHVKSHLDGEDLFLGPREVMEVQEALGGDLVMAFDHCLGLPASREELERAVERTTQWTRVCAESRTRSDQALFGIVQGGTVPALRERSARELVALDLPGYAVGGLAVGESPEAMLDTLDHTVPFLPADRPRYLMGVGTPPQVLEGVARGIDLFDCVLPTRMGRRGHLFTRDGVVRISSRLFERSEEALDDECDCETCRTYSRAYLRHLFATGEHTATTLGSLHNLRFYLSLLADARTALVEQRFATFRQAFTERYDAGQRAWEERVARDPHGKEGSRARRKEQDARRQRGD